MRCTHSISPTVRPETQKWAQLWRTGNVQHHQQHVLLSEAQRQQKYKGPTFQHHPPQNALLHLHERFDGFGFDENGNGVKLCLLQPLDSIARYIQDAVFSLERRRLGSDLPTQSALGREQLAHRDMLTKERSH